MPLPIEFLKDPSGAPPGEALVDAVPVAVVRWQEAPLGTASGDPQDGGQEVAAFALRADIDFRAGPEERENLHPLSISELNCLHSISLHEMSTEPSNR